MTVHHNFCFKNLCFSHCWKATGETICQKGFQPGSEELQTGMFIISVGHFHKIYNKE